MCGIAGIALSRRGQVLTDLPERLTVMGEVMHHRGPDDGGIAVLAGGRVGLVNRRLAIRDLSPAGHMPMSNADGRVLITYNGEIYNTAELRTELESKGYRFFSHSDTEVILHGYEAWGEDVVQRLRGMFAFAILDCRHEPGPARLFLARDRLGIKPLYYAQTSEAFVFASELKALHAARLVSKEINSAGLVGFLVLGSVPNPLTIYRDIRALEPGSMLCLTLEADRVVTLRKRYWSLPTDTLPAGDAVEAVARVRGLLEEAVRIRLVSDVPLGAFLSGGLDSSAVVALMRRATDGPIRTCSMVFEEAEYNEAPYAKAMAEAAGAEHYERVITAGDVARELDRILYAMDQPTADGVNTYFVSQTARQAGLTVALSGLGGDELFGGYPNTFGGVPQMLRLLHRVEAVPGGARAARAAIGLLPDRRRWSKVHDALARPVSLASAYLTRRGLFSPAEARSLVTPEVWQEAVKSFDPIEHIGERSDNGGHGSNGSDTFGWVSRAELSTYTHHQLLRDTDVMSMIHSLEVRVPLLDHVLVETVLRLPAAAKANGAGPKPLLVAALGDLLPPIVRERREKLGFTFPFDRWLRGPLRSSLTDWRPAAGKVLRKKAVDEVRFAYEAGKLHWSRPWSLAVLGAWVGRNQE